MITYKDLLNLMAFAFTIFIIFYAIIEGMKVPEMVVNVIYVIVLLLSQIENLKEVITK